MVGNVREDSHWSSVMHDRQMYLGFPATTNFGSTIIKMIQMSALNSVFILKYGLKFISSDLRSEAQPM